MKMLFVLILVLGAVAAQDSTESRRRYICGRDLARAHSMYCDNLDPAPEDTVPFDLTHVKSISSFTEESPAAAPRTIPERFAHKLRRAAHMSHRREALVETCCTRPCLISELLDHC